MLKYIYILLGCLLATNLPINAQVNRINFTSLSTKDGLLSNSVNAILKDRYGLMWFATDDGLNKFDGTNFTVYRYQRGDTTSLRSNEVLALHEDKKGNLWIGTSGGGLSLYNREKDAFIHYPIKGSNSGLRRNDVIRSICSDYSGKIWIAQFDDLFMLDPATHSISKQELRDNAGRPVKTTLSFVFHDSKQRLWIATDGGLFLYDLKSKTFRHFEHQPANVFSLCGDKVRAIAEDKWGNIWIGTLSGLCKWRPDGSFINCRQIDDSEILCLATDNEGLLWIGTSNGLTLYNDRTNTFRTYTYENGNLQSLTSNWIRCAYIDSQGIYWFGTYRGGITKYEKNINLLNLVLNDVFQKRNTTK
jgi:ligand-binding sensor domain-containing protein